MGLKGCANPCGQTTAVTEIARVSTKGQLSKLRSHQLDRYLLGRDISYKSFRLADGFVSEVYLSCMSVRTLGFLGDPMPTEQLAEQSAAFYALEFCNAPHE